MKMIALAILLDVSVKILDVGIGSECTDTDLQEFLELRADVVSLSNTGPAEFNFRIMQKLENQMAYLSAFFDASPQWSDDMAQIAQELSTLFGSFACQSFFPEVAEEFPTNYIDVYGARDLAIRFFTSYYTAFAEIGMA